MTMLTSSRWSAYYDSDAGNYILEDWLHTKEYTVQGYSELLLIAREVFAKEGMFPGEVNRLIKYVKQELDME